jgi:hypothetical protein
LKTVIVSFSLCLRASTSFKSFNKTARLLIIFFFYRFTATAPRLVLSSTFPTWSTVWSLSWTPTTRSPST